MAMTLQEAKDFLEANGFEVETDAERAARKAKLEGMDEAVRVVKAAGYQFKRQPSEPGPPDA